MDKVKFDDLLKGIKQPADVFIEDKDVEYAIKFLTAYIFKLNIASDEEKGLKIETKDGFAVIPMDAAFTYAHRAVSLIISELLDQKVLTWDSSKKISLENDDNDDDFDDLKRAMDVNK